MFRFCLIATLALCFTSCQRSRDNYAEREAPSGMDRSEAMTAPILSYAGVVDHVAPAVVTIRASRRARESQQFPFMDDPLFREFFGGRLPGARGRTTVERALGSGVIVRADGYILTNHHVVDGAEDIKVDLSNHRTYSAKVVGSDAPSDLALLNIRAGGLPVLELGESDKVRVGDVCLAIGNPLGIGESVTAGIISAKGRSTDTLGNGSFQDFLQTDAPINQGNSGGALVNTRGQLIGINSQILSSNGGNIGIGFAIPSDMARRVMGQLITSGSVQRGMLGVSIQPVTSDIASSLGLKEVSGVLVNAVVPNGPAEKAGVKQGDAILQLNGKDVNDPNEFRNQIAANKPGTEVTLMVWRNNATQQIRVRLGELTAESARQSRQGGNNGGAGKLGVTVDPLTPELASELGLQRGAAGVVVDSVDSSGPGAQAGLQRGDVIEEVNRKPVRSPNDLRDVLQKSGNQTALLLVNRGGQTVYVPVPLE